jgi:hypothetical protein
MNKFCRKLLSLGTLLAVSGGLGAPAQAGEMDGYVMPSFVVTSNMAAVERGIRMGGRLDFGRLAKNIALDLRYNSGLGYKDYGGAFKIFQHWEFSQELAASLGIGALFMASNGIATANPRRAFHEFGLSPFGRVMFETPWHFGLMTEFGVDLVPTRTFTTEPRGTESTLRPRFFVTLGVPFAV